MADIFKPADAGHQFAATYRGIGHRAIVPGNQAYTVALFILQFQTFKKFTRAPLLFTPVSDARLLA